MASYESTTFKNAVCTSAGTNQMKYGALCSTAPTASAFGTELTSGSPAYARIASAWGAASAGAITQAAMAFNVAASTTVVGFGFFDAATVGNYQNACDITSQTFASQGTYSITPTYTQN
jgi:hypothetical protein